MRHEQVLSWTNIMDVRGGTFASQLSAITSSISTMQDTTINVFVGGRRTRS